MSACSLERHGLYIPSIQRMANTLLAADRAKGDHFNLIRNFTGGKFTITRTTLIKHLRAISKLNGESITAVDHARGIGKADP